VEQLKYKNNLTFEDDRADLSVGELVGSVQEQGNSPHRLNASCGVSSIQARAVKHPMLEASVFNQGKVVAHEEVMLVIARLMATTKKSTCIT
jgi:hypothetical protein